MQQNFSAAIDRDRLRFILDHQAHLDRYLSPIADPRGKSVLLVGAGAGTEILWCLEQGAKSVTAIDVKPQPTLALEKALAGRNLRGDYQVVEMGIEDAGSLGRTYDLLISNNVFEHLPDVPKALEVCRQLARPGSGRIAIFSSPLFYSSYGSHLEHKPWEHLWAEPEELRQKLLDSGDLPEYHALTWADLPGFFHEIGLNRLTFDAFFDAVRGAGLLVLGMGTVKDRHVDQLGQYLPRLVPVCEAAGLSVSDLAIEGFWAELAPPEGATSDSYASLLEAQGHGHDIPHVLEELKGSRARVGELEDLLARVEKSPSLRLGRLLTAPLRFLRGHSPS